MKLRTFLCAVPLLFVVLLAFGCGSSSGRADASNDAGSTGQDTTTSGDVSTTQDVPQFDFTIPTFDLGTPDTNSKDIAEPDTKSPDTATPDTNAADLSPLDTVTADLGDGAVGDVADSTADSQAGDLTGDGSGDLSEPTDLDAGQPDVAASDMPSDVTSDLDGPNDLVGGDGVDDLETVGCVDDDLGKTATTVLSSSPLASGTYSQQKLCPQQAADWYRIELAVNEALIVHVGATDGKCYDFEIYQNNADTKSFDVVHYSNDEKAGDNGQVYNMDAGTYYLQVHAFDCQPPFTPHTNATYELRVQIGCNNSDADCATYSGGYYQACVNDLCKHCKNSTQCATHPFGSVCDTSTNFCGCNTDDDCKSSEYGPTCFGLCGCDPNGTACPGGYTCVQLLSDPVFFGCVKN